MSYESDVLEMLTLPDAPRCPVTVDLFDGNILRCERDAGHSGEHRRWFFCTVWHWESGGAAYIQRDTMEAIK